MKLLWEPPWRCYPWKESLPTAMVLLEQFQHQAGHSKRHIHAYTNIGYMHACTYISVCAVLKPSEYRLHAHLQFYAHTFLSLLIFITHALHYTRMFSYRYIIHINRKPTNPLLCTHLYTLLCLLLCMLLQTLLSTFAHFLPCMLPKHEDRLTLVYFHEEASIPRDSICTFKYTGCE